MIQIAPARESGATSWCALLDSGQVKCWGYEGRSPSSGTGALGRGTPKSATQPYPFNVVTAAKTSTVPNPPILTGAIQISGGHQHFCALLDSGEVWCWGRQREGRLGNGFTGPSGSVPYAAPVLAQAPVSGQPDVPLTGVGEITCNDHNSCLVMLNGEVKCWGDNTRDNILGTRSTGAQAIPISVYAGSSGSALLTIFD